MNYYLNPAVIRIFLLGCASGLPWVLIGSMLTLWLKDVGLSRAAIGYASAIFAVYSVNFVWSPLVDRFKIPVLSNLGQRKSWIFLTQILICIGCYLVSQSNPAINPNLTILFCLIIAIASATQDIAIDAYRIDSIPEGENELMSAAAAMATSGWWTGFAGLGAVALWLSDTLVKSWPALYLILAGVVLLLAVIIVFFPEPPSVDRVKHQQAINHTYLIAAKGLNSFHKLSVIAFLISPLALAIWALSGSAGLPVFMRNSVFYIPGLLSFGFALLTFSMVLLANSNKANNDLSAMPNRHYSNNRYLDTLIATLSSSVTHPFVAFFQRNGIQLAINLILFIVLFKIGEAFLGRMSLVFYKEIGFSNTDIAAYSKLGSWIVTIVFSIISGWFTIRYGVVKGLLIAGIAMAASNIMFAVMATVGPVKWVFAITILVDGFTSAWSNVAFVAFLSSLCDRSYTATQYALLASLGTLGRTLFASSSGQMVDGLNGNWSLFFILTAVMVLPSLIILIRSAKIIEGLYQNKTTN